MVSIPLWFDWKIEVAYLQLKPYAFQFHFGSIGRLVVSKIFNSTHVSIPLWFDWKLCIIWNHFLPVVFQFHFGSIGSITDAPEFSTAQEFQFHFGSIGRKLNPGCPIHLHGFNSTLVRLEDRTRASNWFGHNVSIPLWFDWKISRSGTMMSYYFVSIPLWFDWKKACNFLMKHNILFQFHFGSIGRIFFC